MHVHTQVELQQRLDSALALCDHYTDTMRQKYVISTDPSLPLPPNPQTDELLAHRQFAEATRVLTHTLDQSCQEVRSAYQLMLQRCNLLLNCLLPASYCLLPTTY